MSDWEEVGTVVKPDSAGWEEVGTVTPEPKKANLTPVGVGIGVGEGALAVGTGMLAKPLSDVAGLAAMFKNIIGGTDDDVEGFKRMVQDKLTYSPRTKTGELAAEYNPLSLFGKAVSSVAGGVRNVIAPADSEPVRTGVGQGVEELLNQLPALAGGVIGKGAAAVAGPVKTLARNTMQSAIKPSPEALLTGKAGKAIDTMLDEGINVSPGGVDTLQSRIAGLNEKISALVETSPEVINKAKVGSRMVETLDRFMKQVAPLEDVASIQKVWTEFMDHPLLQERNIPVKTAQELKQGTYRTLGDKSYGELKGAEIEAQKTLARGLKEEIAKAVPEVAPLTAEESALLNVLSVSERRILMEANKNPAGLGWLTTNPVKFGAWMADRSGLFKSLVARMLNTTSEALDASTAAAGPASAAVGANASAEAEKRRRVQYLKSLATQ